jgi:hypothetical protein
MIDGIASKPFSAETLEPAKPSHESFRDVIIENSRSRYGTSRRTVEEKIASEWVADKEVIEERVQRREEQRLEKVLTPPEPAAKTEFPKKERKPIDIEDLRKAIKDSLKDIET